MSPPIPSLHPGAHCSRRLSILIPVHISILISIPVPIHIFVPIPSPSPSPRKQEVLMNHLPGKQPQNLILAQPPPTVTSSNIVQPLFSPPATRADATHKAAVRFDASTVL